MNWRDWDGVLFDLDGVLTPTAAVHEQAWLELFEAYDITPQDYLTYIDGRPRYDGVQAFLASRDVSLEWGSPDDAPGDDTVCAIGNRKNDLFHAILERDGVEPYPGSVAVLDLLDVVGTPYGVVSSSRNADPVLRAAGLRDRIGVLVDGNTGAELDLPGKPAPDMFLLGATQIGVPAGRTMVVEDASLGVEAAVAGRFGYVLGVDRGSNAAALRLAGADRVVTDLSEALPTDWEGQIS